jgi:zinc/manganese transport system substrate-binding protein
MKTIFPILFAALFAATAHAKLNVVATTPDLASIAREIGGDKIELTTLAKPTEDPHFVDAKPSFIVKLNRADVLIEGGAELEIGWLPALLDQSRNTKLAAGAPGHVICSTGVQLLEVPATLDRSKGDIHAAGNPHYVVDPVNAKMVAQNIATALALSDAKDADYFQASLKKFDDAIDAKLIEWQATLAPFKGAPVVAYHNSWIYFANRFDLKIAEVITKMKAQHARVIIVDPYLNRKTAETAARSTDATVLDVTQFPGGLKGTEGGYIQLEVYLVNSLAKALAEKK